MSVTLKPWLRFGIFFLGATSALAALAPLDAWACASCGCTLSSDWDSQGLSGIPGFSMDIRYDYLNQDQLRSGVKTISPSAASQISNNGNNQEVEKYTRNNYATLQLDYKSKNDWGVNVQLPYIIRSHSTLGTASDGAVAGPGGGQYDSRTSSLGDAKIIGRYEGFSANHNWGLLLGIKLPTGSYQREGISSDPTESGSVPIDRGLQPGTGTTDAIVGSYYGDALNKNWDYFAQGFFQSAMNSKDNYRPGNSANLNIGLRYRAWSQWTPQIQINTRFVERDTGTNADNVSTGGTLIYLSPGLSFAVNEKVSIYGFLQLPLYQHVNGVQLATRYTLSLGSHFSF